MWGPPNPGGIVHSINVFDLKTGEAHTLLSTVTVMMPGTKFDPMIDTPPPSGITTLGITEYTVGTQLPKQAQLMPLYPISHAHVPPSVHEPCPEHSPALALALALLPLPPLPAIAAASAVLLSAASRHRRCSHVGIGNCSTPFDNV